MAGVDGGAVAGIVIGCLIGVILVVVVIIKLRSHRWIVQRFNLMETQYRDEYNKPKLLPKGKFPELDVSSEPIVYHTQKTVFSYHKYRSSDLYYYDEPTQKVPFDIQYVHVKNARIMKYYTGSFIISDFFMEDRKDEFNDEGNYEIPEENDSIAPDDKKIMHKEKDTMIAVQRGDVLYYYHTRYGLTPFQYVGEEYNVFTGEIELDTTRYWHTLMLTKSPHLQLGNQTINQYFKFSHDSSTYEAFIPLCYPDDENRYYLSCVSRHEDTKTSKIFFTLERRGIFS